MSQFIKITLYFNLPVTILNGLKEVKLIKYQVHINNINN